MKKLFIISVIFFLTSCINKTISSENVEVEPELQGLTEPQLDTLPSQEEIQAQRSETDSIILETYSDVLNPSDQITISPDSIEVEFIGSNKVYYDYHEDYIITKDSSKYCFEGELEVYDYEEKTEVILDSSFLVLKSSYMCDFYFSDNASELVGTEWEYIGMSYQDQDGNCEQTTQEVLNEYQDESDQSNSKRIFTYTYSFSKNVVNYCWASDVIKHLTFLDIPDISEIKKMDCSHVQLVTSGETLNLKMKSLFIQSGTADFEVVFEDDTSCNYTGVAPEELDDLSCQNAYNFYSADENPMEYFNFNHYDSFDKYTAKMNMDKCMSDAGFTESQWLWNIL